MAGERKKQAKEGLTAVFAAQCGALARGKEAAQETARSSKAEVEKLHASIGRLAATRLVAILPPRPYRMKSLSEFQVSTTFGPSWVHITADRSRLKSLAQLHEGPTHEVLDIGAGEAAQDAGLPTTRLGPAISSPSTRFPAFAPMR